MGVPAEAAPAKINLALHVTGRRADGYHLLDSLVVFAGAHDRLAVEPATTLSLTLDGPFAEGLTAEADNLVLRAARALAARYGVEPAARLHLQKCLPVASGIGGGSSDAAAALRALSALWGLSPTPVDLRAIAAGLGADVPVCLHPVPQRMAGIGDVLLPAPAMPDCGILLVNPGIALATAAVFEARSGAFSPPLALPPRWRDASSMADDLSRLRNDLEAPAIALCPVLDEVLAALRQLPACLFARMSGSGATCFALFPTPGQANAAARQLARSAWWSWAGPLWPAPPLYANAPHT